MSCYTRVFILKRIKVLSIYALLVLGAFAPFSIACSWTVLIGPFAWYTEQWSGKSNSSLGAVYFPASVCLLFVVPAFFKDSCFVRVLFYTGFFMWFLCGFAAVGAWI